jgi:Xaa-Pro aminopeptidase
MHGVPDDFPVAPGGTEPFPPEVYRERRARLLARLKSGIAVVFAAKSIDEDADERQDADFAYLTGLADEEKGALLLMPGAPEREMLFLEPKTDDEQHFTGYAAELPRRDVEVKTGFDDVRRMDRLGAYALRFARASRDRELSLLVSSDKLDGPQSPELELLQRVAARLPGAKVVDATRELRAMRMAKEPREIEKIARASDITVAAHLEGWRIGKPGAREWDVKRAIEDAFHKGGARHLAYGSIVGAGPDGCVPTIA